jgi:hypothetical protein
MPGKSAHVENEANSPDDSKHGGKNSGKASARG